MNFTQTNANAGDVINKNMDELLPAGRFLLRITDNYCLQAIRTKSKRVIVGSLTPIDAKIIVQYVDEAGTIYEVNLSRDLTPKEKA